MSGLSVKKSDVDEKAMFTTPMTIEAAHKNRRGLFGSFRRVPSRLKLLMTKQKVRSVDSRITSSVSQPVILETGQGDSDCFDVSRGGFWGD